MSNDTVSPDFAGSIDDLATAPVAEAPAAPVEVPAVKVEASPRQKVTTNPTWSVPLPKPGEPLLGYYFSLPSVPYKKMVETVQSLDESELNDKDEKTAEWKRVVNESTDLYTPNGMFTDDLYLEGRNYLPGWKDEKGALVTMAPVPMATKTGEIDGFAAIVKMAQKLELGEFMNVPLVHSGIWLQVRPPAEREIIDFYNMLFRDKIAFGRKTSGFTLSNFSAYTNAALTDFIIAHVYSTNIAGLDIKTLKDHIYVQDYYALVWGFASAIYPLGFDYKRPCVADPKICKHVEEGRLNLTKIYHCDDTAMSQFQRQHMSSYKANTRNLDQLQRYKAEHTRIKNSYFVTPKGIRVNVVSPTIGTHVAQGTAWVDYIVEAIDKVVIGTDEKSEKEKEAMLSQYIRTSLIRQYSHFIESVEFDDMIIKEPNALIATLEMLSASDDERDKLLKDINRYLEETTFALIGIETYNCPSCKKSQQTELVNERFTEIIPIDVVELFFGLITLRISKTMERNI